MPTFEFADCPTSVKIDAPSGAGEQTGRLNCTIRNMAQSRQTGRIRIEPQGSAKAAWFSLGGAVQTSPLELEQDFAPGGAMTVQVIIKVPPDTPPGSQTFRLRVTSEQTPDTDFADGPTVAFEIAPTKTAPVPPPAFPLWAIAVAAALVIVVVGAILWISLWPSKPTINANDFKGKIVADARKIATDRGYSPITQEIGQPGGFDVGYVNDAAANDQGGIVLKTDPGVTIPPVKGQNALAAVQKLAGLGILVKAPPATEQNAALQDDEVIRTDPAEGTPVKLGATITMTINNKPVSGTNPPTRWFCLRHRDLCRPNTGYVQPLPSSIEKRLQMNSLILKDLK